MDVAQYVTKLELEKILDKRFAEFYVRMEKMVGEVVGEIVGNALQLISERFDKLEARMERMEKRMGRVEKKLDQVSATVSLHSSDILSLQQKLD